MFGPVPILNHAAGETSPLSFLKGMILWLLNILLFLSSR